MIVRLGLLALAVILVLVVANLASTSPAPVVTSTASIAGAGTSRVLSPDFSGFSSNGDAADWASPQFLPAVQGLDPESLRGYPSGTGSNYFNWSTGQFFTTAVGHSFVTPTQPDPPDQLSLFLRTVKRTHSAAVFDINVMTYCPVDVNDPTNTDQAGAQCTRAQACGPDAAAYALQCTNPDLTWGLPFELRLLQAAAQQGVAVRYVELGNELYGTGDYAYYFPTVQSYVAKMNVWIAAIRAAFPGVQIGVVGFAANDCRAKAYTAPALAQREASWNAAVLSGVRGESALTLHTYYQSQIATPGTVISRQDRATMLSTAAQSCIAAVRTQVLDQLPHGVAAWVTEWNLYPTDGVLEYGSWAQGLTEATYALELTRQPAVALMENESLINTQIYGALFSAVNHRYANSTTNKRILLPAHPAPIVQPFAMSAGGTVLAALNRSLHGATATAALTVAGGPAVAGTATSGLLGQSFTVAGRTNLYFVNLSPDRVQLSLGAFAGSYSVLDYSAGAGSFVVGAGSVHTRPASARATVVLAPYSVASLVAK